jgi:hypothetical protein
LIKHWLADFIGQTALSNFFLTDVKGAACYKFVLHTAREVHLPPYQHISRQMILPRIT